MLGLEWLRDFMKSVAIIGDGITGLTAAFDVAPGMDKVGLP